MADTHCHNHEQDFDPFSCTKSKSEVQISGGGCSSKLENAVNKFVERRGDLAARQRYLRDKVSTMERSIPALMAFNMWMSGQNCTDAPLCKIRELMNKFSPYPDPAEKLLQNLKKTVEDLNQEISEMHEKIIAADVDLEESGMELESLELSNKEMDAELKTLEKEISAKSTLSLHSIHSEDLICLSRIRQLGEEERSLKCCIKQLEEKEIAYRQQMESLLVSKDFQNSSGCQQMTRRLKELETSDKKWRCTYQTQKFNMQQMKKKILEKDQKLTNLENKSQVNQLKESSSFDENHTQEKDDSILTKKKLPTSWADQKNFSCDKKSNFPPRSCCVPLSKYRNSDKKSCSCSSRSGYPQKNISLKNKFCAENPLCQSPPCEKNSTCPPIKSSVGTKYPPHRKSGCRCSCKGKCSKGLSGNPCNCGTEIKSNYRPSGNNDEESSEDEFRECNCGCNDEDVPGACLQFSKNCK